MEKAHGGHHHVYASKDPRDHEVDPDVVNASDNFALYGVFQLVKPLPAQKEEREALAKDAEKDTKASGAEIRGWYDVAGYRSDAELMMWVLADSADKVQAAYHAVLNSRLGEYLKPAWSNMSAHMTAEFNAPHLPACFGGWAPREYMAVYPLNRSWDWYYLKSQRRSAMLREHGLNGDGFWDVGVSTLATFGLSDYEWTVALEHDNIRKIMGVLRQQRNCEARLFVRKDWPFYTGKRMPLTEWVEQQRHA